MITQNYLSDIIQNYFYQRLINQKDSSPCTISSYRDTFKLFLTFVHDQKKIKPSQLKLTDLNTDMIVEFLDYLEIKRKNSVRTRNTRLVVLRSFLHYAALQNPVAMSIIRPILAIPLKKFDRPLVDFLTREEMNAIINSPDATVWNG